MNQKRIYVSGKFTGSSDEEEQENIRLACTYGKELWRIGFAALTPHTNCNLLSQEARVLGLPYEAFLEFDLWILTFFDAIFMLPNWRDSKGAGRERALALALKIPIFHNLNEAREWLWREQERVDKFTKPPREAL